MGRQERRAISKLQKRRLRWLEKLRKRDSIIDQVVAQIEEDFDEEEVNMAKVFFVDYLTDSGLFADTGEELYLPQLGKICKEYGLEVADAMLIMDMAEDIFSAAERGDKS